MVTAGYDPLRDEGEALARGCSADNGVEVTSMRYPSMIHGFLNSSAPAARRRRYNREIADRLLPGDAQSR